MGDADRSLGAAHPTAMAARAIATGDAALAQLARTSRTPIVLVDAGVREPMHMPDITVRIARQDDAVAQLEAGIALAVTLAEGEGEPLRVLALGSLGLGTEIMSAEILGAATGIAPSGLGDPVAEARGAVAARGRLAGVELLKYGGLAGGVLAGLILGAAAMNIAIVLDGHATAAAALIAAQIACHVPGYLIAAHRGHSTMPLLLGQLGLEPVFDVGLGHGEGSGGALILPLIDQVASLVGE